MCQSLKEMQADGVALKSKAQGVFKAAKSLSASLNKPSRMLGEPGESISNLERELKDAKETKQMLRRDAQAALHRQQKLEDASAESALVKMRESKQSAVKVRPGLGGCAEYSRVVCRINKSKCN